MKLIRNTLAAGFAVAAVSLAACSSQHGSTGSAGSGGGAGSVGSLTGQGHGDLGSVGMRLTIGNGVHVNQLTWTISNGTNSYSGVVNITDDAGHEAQSVEFVAGGIVAGMGYIVTLTGSDSSGDPCSGMSAAVTVTAGATSSAVVLVTCTSPTDAAIAADVKTGSIAVDAAVTLVSQSAYACPGVTSVAVSPAEVLPPETAALTSTSTPGSGGVETILWSTSCAGASITNPTSPNAVFNCGSVTGSSCTVTLTVGLDGSGADGGPLLASDGGPVNVCTTQNFLSMSETIVCEAGGATACFSPTPNSCPTADGGTTCVNLSTDNNNCGSCGKVCTSPNVCGIVGSATTATCNPPPAVPCTGGTTGNNTPAGCIPCLGSANGVCSQTEAIVLNYDIKTNGLTSSTATTKAASCYYCMVAGGCLDSVTKGTVTGVTTQGKTNLECEDTASGNDSSASPTDCRDALTCTLTTSHCTTTTAGAASTDPNASVSNCYCGTNLGAACTGTGTGQGPNGPCKTNETTDIGGFVGATDPTTILSDFTTSSLSPGGVGNQVLNCALTSACNICFN